MPTSRKCFVHRFIVGVMLDLFQCKLIYVARVIVMNDIGLVSWKLARDISVLYSTTITPTPGFDKVPA